MLDYLGALDRFVDSFDIDFYNRNFHFIYKDYLINSDDIKKNLRDNKKRYREIRDTVLAKHIAGKNKKIAVKWAVIKGKTMSIFKKIVKGILKKIPKIENLVRKMYIKFRRKNV